MNRRQLVKTLCAGALPAALAGQASRLMRAGSKSSASNRCPTQVPTYSRPPDPQAVPPHQRIVGTGIVVLVHLDELVVGDVPPEFVDEYPFAHLQIVVERHTVPMHAEKVEGDVFHDVPLLIGEAIRALTRMGKNPYWRVRDIVSPYECARGHGPTIPARFRVQISP